MEKRNKVYGKFAEIFIRLGVIAAVSFGFYVFKPAEQTVTEKAAYYLQAKQLYGEFKKDETKATDKYLNKVIAIDGEVTDISMNENVGAIITLNANNKYGVSCNIPHSNTALDLKIGDKITVKGLCTGKLMDVVLIKCTVEKKHNI